MTDDTITLPRASYEALMMELRDLRDSALIAERRNDPTFPFEVVERLLDGDHPVTVFREHRGLTQAALAAAADISRQMLNEIEHGKKTPSIPVGLRIARALDVDLDDLFGEHPS